MSVRTPSDRWVADRVAEVVHFVDELRLEYRTKACPAEWDRVLAKLSSHFLYRHAHEHLHDGSEQYDRGFVTQAPVEAPTEVPFDITFVTPTNVAVTPAPCEHRYIRADLGSRRVVCAACGVTVPGLVMLEAVGMKAMQPTGLTADGQPRCSLFCELAVGHPGPHQMRIKP